MHSINCRTQNTKKLCTGSEQSIPALVRWFADHMSAISPSPSFGHTSPTHTHTQLSGCDCVWAAWFCCQTTSHRHSHNPVPAFACVHWKRTHLRTMKPKKFAQFIICICISVVSQASEMPAFITIVQRHEAGIRMSQNYAFVSNNKSTWWRPSVCVWFAVECWVR